MGFPIIAENFLQSLMAGCLLGAIYGLMCVGLALIFGVMRVINFAQEGARYTLMQGMGHFPMIENYPAFRPFLVDALDHVTAETHQEAAQ